MDIQFNPDNLPPSIARLWNEVSRQAGNPVEWTDDELEEADMIAEWHDRDPIVFHTSDSHASAARELVHLKLDLRGYPEPRVAPSFQYPWIEQLLHQLLRRSMSFPTVRKMGYEPEPGERHWVARWHERIRQASPQVNCDNVAAFDLHVALLLAHARRFCGRTQGAPDLAPFDCDERYQRARLLADHLDQAINLKADSSVFQYRQNLDRCTEILGLSGCAVATYPCAWAHGR